MSKYIAKIRKFIFSGLRHVVSLILLTTFLVSITTASTVTDGSTPLSLSPGTHAGAYALSGFDNINVYNGNLNFYLPLLTVGGRGNAAHTIGRMMEQHWRMDHF